MKYEELGFFPFLIKLFKKIFCIGDLIIEEFNEFVFSLFFKNSWEMPLSISLDSFKFNVEEEEKF